MRTDKKNIKVVFRHYKKEESQRYADEAFDFLFDEVFRLMNEKPVMATK